jgi:signal transduction histidine kinase
VLAYTILGLIAVASYALLVTGAAMLLGTAWPGVAPLVIGALAFGLALAFHPLLLTIQAGLARLQPAPAADATPPLPHDLEGYSRAMAAAEDPATILAALHAQLAETLPEARSYVFLPADRGRTFAAEGTDLVFTREGPLVQLLETHPGPLSDLSAIPGADGAKLRVLAASLVAALKSGLELDGVLIVNGRRPLSADKIRLISTLADQTGVALERAAAVADLNRRVRDLDVISQMSQALSFTLAYDDLLELIYAQTTKILPADHFAIVIADKRRETVEYAFYLDHDERVAAFENRAVPIDHALEHEVVRAGAPARAGLALAVPLIAGQDVLGALVMSGHTAYSDDQVKIATTIADQAASALMRARLLREAEARARQLATLNDISLTIASTLDLDRLLERVVASAVDVLGAEAGSLYLVDDETGEYVFRVAVGPVGQNLVGMRIQPGRGFVGEAIERGRAVIVHDVQNDSRWFKGTDDQTGFDTRSLITVPLRLKDKAVGAIQLLNKRDGSRFAEDDQNLLTALAAPAAISIENARLFTQTDQALAARVEELSIMQRIDRELNTSLDIQQVMALTLDWAMKQTRAVAGSVSILTDEGLRIIATQGYGDTVEGLQDRPIPTDRGIMGRVARTGQLSLVRDVRQDPDYRGVLGDTRSQLTMPIQHEQRVVGVINLESRELDGFSEDMIDFSARLIDHASIAIANARLYAQVAAANSAKSDLMSFVAHELKTPMTPIKGYADILLSGAVGPLTDPQKQFLAVIRNNIERMKTIVTDMNDSARIEAGKLRLDLSAVDAKPIIDECVATARTLFDAKRQTLTVEVPEALPSIQADGVRFAQVLTNLLSNAHKYTPEGGLIALRTQVEGDRLHLCVQDNGIGIAPEDQAKLFQKFFRAEDRLAREMAPGTGLGLNIVKHLVELQGGSIWFESELRRGSTFHVTLPLAVSMSDRGPQTADRGSQGPRP